MTWRYLTPADSVVSFEERLLPRLVQLEWVSAETLVWHPGLDVWKPCAELKPELFAEPHTGDTQPMTRAAALASIRYHCKDCGANNMISGPKPKCWLCRRPLDEFQPQPRSRPQVPAARHLPQPPPGLPGSGERPQVKRSPGPPVLIAIAIVLVVFGLWVQSAGLGLLLAVCLAPGLLLAMTEACKRSKDPYTEAGASSWITATAVGLAIAVVVPVMLAVAAVVAVLVICSGL